MLLCVIQTPRAIAGNIFLTYQENDAIRNSQQAPSHGDYQISLADNLFLLPAGSELYLTIKGLPTYEVIHDRKVTHANGSVSWFGYLKQSGQGFRVSLIKGENFLQGTIRTPEGQYKIQTRDQKLYLTDLEEKGLREVGTGPDDFKVQAPDKTKHPAAKDQVPAVEDNTITTIDLMILYNQAFASRYPGTTLETRLNELVALSNQAYIDSRVYINLRLVHYEEVLYNNANSNNTALDAMTEGKGIFANVSLLRAQYGADLVMLLRPFDAESHNSCGIAWLNGFNGTDISLYADKGFNSVLVGEDDQWYCSDLTFPHELGHNMGNAHDRDHASIGGVYPYSYGYDEQGTKAFGTIMSYDDPRIGYFSNPDITKCNGRPCGLPVSDINAAYNALSMNNTRKKVAGFVKTALKIAVQRITIPYLTKNGDYWSGLAIHNESNASQTFTVSLYDANGSRIGVSDCIEIAPRGMHVDLIENLISETVKGRVSMVIRTVDKSTDRFSVTVYIGKGGSSGQGFSFSSYKSESYETSDIFSCPSF